LSLNTARPWLALYDEGLPAEIAPVHPNVLAMFRAAVASSPDAGLLRYFKAALTARRVDELSDGLAVGLAELGLRRGDRLALYLQNVPQHVLALLAAWKLGAVVVPCNPMLRDRELVKLLRDSGATILVALESLYGDLAGDTLGQTDVRQVITTSELDLLDGPVPAPLLGSARRRVPGSIDLLELAEANRGLTPPEIELGPDDIALLSYTSGTTGPSKGAMNTHGGIVFTSEVFREWLHAGPDDVIFALAPLFHITGMIAHIGISFSAASPLVLAYRFDASETCRLVEHHRVSFMLGAITAYIAIAADQASERYDLSSITKAYSGGAPVPPSIVEAFEQRTGIAIRTAYGLTETTAPTHVTPLGRRPPVDAESGALAAGIPVFNTRARIIGERGEELVCGEIGEVVLSGPQVIPGYWNNPEESERAIRDGELRTGDVGKIDEHGWLYIVDRKKDLIIASGYKVWPREVEDVLYEHPSVREAAVIGVPDAYRGETVHAFVSPRPGDAVEPAELMRFCRERLAAYKCPRVVTLLDDLPKSPAGKILRRSIRELATHDPGVAGAPSG
jgi:long-chain acyl-CoA synthetase